MVAGLITKLFPPWILITWSRWIQFTRLQLVNFNVVFQSACKFGELDLLFKFFRLVLYVFLIATVFVILLSSIWFPLIWPHCDAGCWGSVLFCLQSGDPNVFKNAATWVFLFPVTFCDLKLCCHYCVLVNSFLQCCECGNTLNSHHALAFKFPKQMLPWYSRNFLRNFIFIFGWHLYTRTSVTLSPLLGCHHLCHATSPFLHWQWTLLVVTLLPSAATLRLWLCVFWKSVCGNELDY
jgi:hypothetical protein